MDCADAETLAGRRRRQARRPDLNTHGGWAVRHGVAQHHWVQRKIPKESVSQSAQCWTLKLPGVSFKCASVEPGG